VLLCRVPAASDETQNQQCRTLSNEIRLSLSLIKESAYDNFYINALTMDVCAYRLSAENQQFLEKFGGAQSCSKKIIGK
jgi:hypothetical protein